MTGWMFFGQHLTRQQLQAKHILIATGAKAHKLPIEGAEHSIISDHVLDLPERPKKMAIVGGGYIAVEFAGIFNNYGTDVHLIYRQVGSRCFVETKTRLESLSIQEICM